MNITIAAATRFEIREDLFKKALHPVHFLYTGVGMLLSAVNLTQHVFQHKPDLIIQAGIGGCFDEAISLGTVLAVEKEYLGDTGVWETEGWKDIFDMGFQNGNERPFSDKGLVNDDIAKWNVSNLPLATGVTINEITTSPQTKEMLKTRYSAVLESMEGASLHYVCKLMNIPFLQVRGVSNYIGERNKSKWKIKDAISNVNEAVAAMLALL